MFKMKYFVNIIDTLTPKNIPINWVLDCNPSNIKKELALRLHKKILVENINSWRSNIFMGEELQSKIRKEEVFDAKYIKEKIQFESIIYFSEPYPQWPDRFANFFQKITITFSELTNQNYFSIEKIIKNPEQYLTHNQEWVRNIAKDFN